VPGFTPLRTVLFRRALRSALAGCRSLLDVGCGGASPLAATGFRGLAVGVDISAAALRDARRSGFHRALVQADAAALDRVFRPRSFDAVVALDVIEHLAREAALALVAALERTARRRVVIFTPNGFVAQPPRRTTRFNCTAQASARATCERSATVCEGSAAFAGSAVRSPRCGGGRERSGTGSRTRPPRSSTGHRISPSRSSARRRSGLRPPAGEIGARDRAGRDEGAP